MSKPATTNMPAEFSNLTEKTSSFNGTNQIDRVVGSLNAFKRAIYNVNYLIKIVRQNKESIIKAGEYDSVISPIINKKFDTVRLCIFSIATDKKKWNEGKCYYSFVNPEWSNKSLNNPSNFGIDTSITPPAPGAPQKVYELLNMFIFDNIDYLNKMLKNNPNNKMFYQFTIHDWFEGPYIVLRFIQPDVLNENKWIQITTLIMLREFFPDASSLSIFNPEYINFVKTVSSLIEDIETKNWNDYSLVKNVWEYSSISKINNTKCLLSTKYPNWNGQLISDCFIPNSNINVQSNMKQLFDDLYFYYPSLTVGEIAFSTRNVNGTNILSICKIDTYNGVQCIKEINILLDIFFKNNNIIGDTTIYGNLNITDGNNKSVIQTDNVTKNISVSGKIGINQDLHEITGLLDIDNLSIDKFMYFFDNITNISNISYNVTTDILNNNSFIIKLSNVSSHFSIQIT